MRAAVRDAFVPFTAPLEGVVPWLYLDVKGLVTVAIGNLVDPIAVALSLPLVRRADGQPASQAEIADEWHLVKGHATAARDGHRVLESVTRLRLTDAGVREVVGRKLDEMDARLAARFPEYPEWPADAQLATLSMAWACGPAFAFPALAAALRARDFARAATECSMSTVGNAGVAPRNRANRALYELAAKSAADGRDPEDLLFEVAAGATTTVADGRAIAPMPPIVHPDVDLDPTDSPLSG